MITFSCPPCNKLLQVTPEQSGKKVSCPGCGQRLRIPARSALNQTVLGNLHAEGVAPALRRPASNIPANALWHYVHGGRQQGPVLLRLLQELARAGHLLPADLVWTPALGKWTAAQTVAEIFAPPQAAPQPAEAPALLTPSVSQLSLTTRRRPRSLHQVGVVAACGALLACILFLWQPFAKTAAPKQETTGKDLSPEVNVYKKTLPGCVGVCRPGDCFPSSGWIVDLKKKWVITNKHVVGLATSVEVMFPAYRPDGHVIHEEGYYLTTAKRYPARVLSVDGKRDLALVELESMPAGVAALPLATQGAREGDKVHLVGNAGLNQALWGYVSGHVRLVARQYGGLAPGQNLDAVMGLSDMATNGGDSGAAVVNDQGEVVGTNSCHRQDLKGPSGHVAGYIDLSEVKAFLKAPYEVSGQNHKKGLFDALVYRGKNFTTLLNLQVRTWEDAGAKKQDPRPALENLLKENEWFLFESHASLKSLREFVDRLAADPATPADVREKLAALLTHCEEMKRTIDGVLTFSDPYAQYANQVAQQEQQFNQMVSQLQGILGGNP
jgi:S1-C subfamily serine protease